MAGYVFFSHDGFGLGHVRRNALLADAVLRQDPEARVTLVTGVARRPSWLDDPRWTVVGVPPLVKDSNGVYAGQGVSTADAALARRAVTARAVEEAEPDVVVVDRHPFGIGGELRAVLERARSRGARLVLGLRDVLDEPDAVRAELAGPGWDGVGDLYDDILVYGDRMLCDHQSEYGLPIEPVYCGWVVARPEPVVREDDAVLICAGGGGDGAGVLDLGRRAVALRPGLREVVLSGPYATSRSRGAEDADRNAEWFARAGASVQMAGYNSTAECLAAGLRPVLVPRTAPRREQAIRAGRLASLGLADVVDVTASPAEVAWLLDRPRLLGADECVAAGISFDGADVAARLVAAAPAVHQSHRFAVAS